MEDFFWNKFLSGDRQAFEHLFKLLYGKLYGYGLKICHNETIVEDCIQDLFLYLFEHSEKLVGIRAIKAYTLASTRRKILSKIAETGKMNKVSLGDMSIRAEELIEEQPTFGIARDDLSKMLSTLSPRQREVIYLKYHNDLKVREIAEIMEVSPQSVSNFLQKSFTKIRKNLEEDQILKVFQKK